MEGQIEIWMSFVGFVMAISGVPQILKLLKRKSSDDVSVVLWYLVGFGQLNWIGYGFYKDSISIILTNLFCILVCTVLIILVHKYKTGGKNA